MASDLIPIPEEADQFLMEWEKLKGRPVSIGVMRERLVKAGKNPELLEQWMESLEEWVRASGLSGKDAQFIHNGFERTGKRAKVIILSAALVRKAIESVDA